MSDSDQQVGYPTFEVLYCRERQIDPSRFERSLVIDGVSIVLRPVVKLMIVILPGLFRAEMEYLSSFRRVQDRRQFAAEIGAITDFNLYQLPRWRAALGLRVSTRRLSRLRKLLPKNANVNLAA